MKRPTKQKLAPVRPGQIKEVDKKQLPQVTGGLKTRHDSAGSI